MEKIFKSEVMTTVGKWGVSSIFVAIFAIYLYVEEISAFCGIIVAIPYIFSDHYNPSAKGWQWRTCRRVVRYRNGLKKRFFPITPADPEGLIAALKEKSPALELQYTYK